MTSYLAEIPLAPWSLKPPDPLEQEPGTFPSRVLGVESMGSTT